MRSLPASSTGKIIFSVSQEAGNIFLPFFQIPIKGYFLRVPIKYILLYHNKMVYAYLFRKEGVSNKWEN
jgi:hypothetical protein